MNAFTLSLDEDFFDFDLMGISSNFIEDYRFIYHLNRHSSFQFKREADLDLFHKQGSPTHFSVFSCIYNDKELYIIGNNSNIYPKEKGQLINLFDGYEILVPSKKRYNYLLKGDCLTELNKELFPLKEQSIIQDIQLLDVPHKIKEKLIF